jgi:hypothetical protein
MLLPPDHFHQSLFPQLDHYTAFICGPKSKGLSQAIQMINRNNNCRINLTRKPSEKIIIILSEIKIASILKRAGVF